MADAPPSWDDLPSFDSLPDAPTSKGGSDAPSWDALPSWDDLPDHQGPEAEGPVKSAVREFAHNLLPGAAGMAAMVPAAALGAPAGPIGAFATGAGGFIAGSMGAEYAQDKFLKNVVGYDDDPQRQANREANPKSSFAGGLAGGMATMSPMSGAKSLGEQVLRRGAGAVAMSGFEAGGEALQGENLDPTKIAIAGAAGAVAPGVNPLGEKIQAGARAAMSKVGWVPGRPGRTPNPEAAQAHEDVGDTSTPQTAPGNAVEQDPVGPTGETIGNPQSAPSRSEKNYGKGTQPVTPENDMLTMGDMDPATQSALQMSTERAALTTDAQTAEIPQRPAGMPQEDLPIKTGIEEAAGVPNTSEAIGRLQVPKKGPRRGPQVVEPGFPEPEKKPVVDPSASGGLNTPASGDNEERPPAAAAAIRASKGKQVDAGFPKPGDVVAYGGNPTAKDVLGRITQPEKKGTTTPNDQLSDAQKRAGNYQKAAIRDFGHDLKVETDRGDMRRSLDDSPVKWEHPSPADYGYFKKTIGADKDHVDFYRATPEMPEFGDKHFIVDQRNPETGKFDEHKVMNYFKDLDSARDTYFKAFGDNSGMSRLHDIREVSPEDLTTWLRTAAKKKPFGTPIAKEKAVPKVVTAAVTALKEAGRDAEAAHIQTLPAERQGVEAARKLQELKTGKKSNITTARIRSAPPKVEGLGVQAKDLEDAARKKGAIDAFQKLYDDHAPTAGQNSPETREQTIARARAAVQEAAKLDQYPMKMGEKQAPAQWLREAKKIIRRPTDQMLTDFRANEELLRSGKKEAINDVRDTNRINADKDLARGRGGDVAEAAGDTAGPIEHVPGEEPTEMKAEPVKNAADLSKLITKNKELDLTNTKDANQAAADTKKIVANLIRINDKDAGTAPVENRAMEANSYVKRGSPTKAPKREAGEVRHIKIDDPKEIQKILDAANKSSKHKGLTDEQLDEQDLSKQPDLKPRDTARDDRLWKRFLDDPTASLDINKIKADAKRYLDLAKAMAERGAGWSKNPVSNPRHMRAIEMRAEGKTFPEIGKELGGVSEQTARQLYLAGTTKLAERSPEHLVSKFLGDESGTINHARIAADFRAKNMALRKGIEKYFGVPVGEVGKKFDSVLARSASTADSKNAEIAKQLRERWLAWTKGSTEAEQWKYLKTLEKLAPGSTHADIEAELLAAGLPKEKVGWMAADADLHKSIMDNIWLEDKKHGSTADYIESYVPHIFKGDARLAAEYLQQQGVKSLGANWYQKQRTFDLLEQAVKAGFKPKFSNPIDIISARWQASAKSNMIVATARALHDVGLAFPVKEAPKVLLERDGWQFKRVLPDHQQWVFAPGTENQWINAMEAKGLNENQNAVGGLYRAWMAAKRVWAPIQLSFSAFHFMHVVANINIAQNLDRALKQSKDEFMKKDVADAMKASLGHAWDATRWSLKDPLLALPIDKIPLVGKFLDGSRGRFSNFPGRRIMDIWETPLDQLTPQERMVKHLFQEGGISPHQSNEDIIGAKREFARAIADLRNGNGTVGPAARILFTGIARGIEKMQEPMFKYQIPELKNVAYLRSAYAAMARDPDLATNFVQRGVVLRDLGKTIDNRYGEMFYKSLFWNKTVKDAGIGSFLSMSWNLGQAREVYGAAKNVGVGAARLAGYKQDPMADAIYRHSDKATFVASYVGVSMMAAGALSYMLTGEMPTGLDYVFPRNGQKNPDGSPARLSTPFNTREPFMLKAHAEQHNSWAGGAAEFMWNKMVLSPLVEIFNNKDFYGSKLYDPNTSWYKKALQTVDSTAGRMFNPIALSGADRAKQQGGGKVGQALAYAGFNPAPKYVEATPMQNRINHLFSDEGTPYSKPYEYGDKTGLGRGLVQGSIRALKGDKLQSEARVEGRQKMEQGRLHGDAAGELEGRREMIQQGGLSPRTGASLRPDTEFQYKYSRLPKETQRALAKDMSQEEFNKYVVMNTQRALSPMTKAQIIKDRSTNQ